MATQPASQRPCDRCGNPSETALCEACRARLATPLAAAALGTRLEAPEAPPPLTSVSLSTGPPVAFPGDLLGPAEVVTSDGSITVGGRVGAGWSLEAADSVTVEELVDGADIIAGIGAVRLNGPCRGAQLRVGMARAAFLRVAEELDAVTAPLTELVTLTAELRHASAIRGRDLTPEAAFAALVTHRAPDAEDRFRAALAILRSAREDGGPVLDALTEAVAAARSAIAGHDVRAVSAALPRVAAALAPARVCVGTPPRSIVDNLASCDVVTAGDLVVRGSGAKDCDLVVGGDLVAAGTGGTVAGGTARVTGKVAVENLGTGGATLVRLEGTRIGERLRATHVSAGVEVEVAGDTVGFRADRRDVVISVVRGRVEVEEH